MSKPLRILNRDSGPSQPPALGLTDDPPPVVAATRLWMALTLSNLPTATLGIDAGQPVAVVADQKKDRLLVCLNAAANARGLAVGMKFNAALAMVPDLIVYPRQPQREKQLLERIAAWSYRFTSVVSVMGSDAVLLEIGGSLRLFGGHEALKTKVLQLLRRFGVNGQACIAPTPLAALWLSRANAEDVMSKPALSARLGELPLSVLRWPSKVQTALEQMGLVSLQDCFRLPRDGLNRRLGPEYLQELDQALGRVAHPQPRYAQRRRLTCHLNLDAEITDAARLYKPVEQLLDEMAIELRKRQQGVDEIHFELRHLHHASTRIVLNFGQPELDAGRFARVFEDRLQRVKLIQPVVAIVLRTGRLESVNFENDSLCMPGLAPASEVDRGLLLERLRARLGHEAVCGLCLVAEHRPEDAWGRARQVGAVMEAEPEWGERRPLWLLAEPLPLVVNRAGPCYEGQLQIIQGPERIETGWWDGREVARDYYIAADAAGSRLWIYRQRYSRQAWYLHGIFS